MLQQHYKRIKLDNGLLERQQLESDEPTFEIKWQSISEDIQPTKKISITNNSFSTSATQPKFLG